MAPVAAHGLANVAAEQASAKGVSRFGTIYTASSYASCTLEEIRAAGGQEAPQWFQFYMSKDDGINKDILAMAKRNGAKAIVLTADATVGAIEKRIAAMASPFRWQCRSFRPINQGSDKRWMRFTAPQNKN